MSSDSESSSSNTTNTSYRTDSIQGEGNILSGGDTVITDSGAIKGNIEITSKTLDTASDLVGKVLNFGDKSTSAALNTATQSIAGINKANDQAISSVLAAKQNESTGISKTLVLTVGAVAAAALVFLGLRKG